MAIDAFLRDPELGRVADELAALVRPAIRLAALPREADTAPLGASAFGGVPDLPVGVPWPVARLRVPVPTAAFRRAYPEAPHLPPDGRLALPFIAQIALTVAHPYDAAGLLPTTGLLSFFYNPIAYPSDAEGGEVLDNVTGLRHRHYGHDDPANWRVLYHPATADLTRAAPPGDLPAPPRYAPVAIAFAAEPTLPAVETCFIDEAGGAEGRVVLTEEEWAAYAELRASARANRAIHQMLGHPDVTQPFAMERAYAALRPRLFPDLPARADLPAGAWQRELAGARLLLQVDELPDGPPFGRDGRAFFFIREADLLRGDFARAWLVAP
jgi:hypothetical protein